MSEFGVRVIAGIIGALALIGIIYIGGILINIFVFLLTLIGLFELRRAFKIKGITLNKYFLILIPVINFFELYFRGDNFYTIYAILAVGLIDLLFFRKNLIDVAAMVFSLLYLVLGFSALVLIREPIIIGLVFIIAFSTDTFAYLVGITMGKTKLIPDVSPNKSIEGALGGVIASAIITYLYLSYFELGKMVFDFLLGISGAAIAQIGDLVASRIKRDIGIKDYGNLIPGHGGILDRFDSVILVGPVIYLLYYNLYF